MECADKGLDILAGLLADPTDAGMELLVGHLDLVFKWLTLRLCERESVKSLNKMLEVMAEMLTKVSGWVLFEARCSDS